MMSATRTGFARPERERCAVAGICSIEGCVGSVRSRGWCSRHYQRWKNHDDPLYFPDRTRPRCSVAECGKVARSRGLCQVHYARLLRTGTTDVIPRKPKDPLYGTDRKTCRTCREGKARSEFSHSDATPDGLYGVCKPCWAKRQRVLREMTYEQYRARERKYLLAKHGLSPEDFDRLHAEQNGKCAICGGPPVGKSSTHFVVDHDHATGKVRGLLCGPCNSFIGLAQENVGTLLSAAEYLTRHAAVMA